ncbi:MAG: DUF4258 domain-containing protein [Deltaproteobacteria bacterium]|nr:DUF4258 domain-containing protein [Deltaproteobacteria bacterium]
MVERKLPGDPLSFIRECIRGGRILWSYHVNMRLGQRFIARETIIQAADSYEIVEEYPADKYFPSYLLLGRQGENAFHVLFGTDVDDQNVRIVTAYYPSPEEWEADLKTRRRSP